MKQTYMSRLFTSLAPPIVSCAPSEEQRLEIAAKNGVQLVLNGLREHAKDADVQSNGCHALANLAGKVRITCRAMGATH